MEFKLDLREVAIGYFSLSEESSDLEKAIASEAINFAHVCIREYQSLEQKAIATLTQQIGDEEDSLINVLDDFEEEGDGPSAITATELIKVVDLQRSLRGGNSAAGDIYTILSYLWARSAQEVDWSLILQELADSIPGEEEPKQ